MNVLEEQNNWAKTIHLPIQVLGGDLQFYTNEVETVTSVFV